MVRTALAKKETSHETAGEIFQNFHVNFFPPFHSHARVQIMCQKMQNNNPSANFRIIQNTQTYVPW